MDSSVTLLIAIAGLAVSAFTVMMRMFDRSPSLREHTDLQNAIYKLERQVGKLPKRWHYMADIRRIEERLNRIEDTRPTTGELEARFGGPVKTNAPPP
jgi:hypothetical protein